MALSEEDAATPRPGAEALSQPMPGGGAAPEGPAAAAAAAAAAHGAAAQGKGPQQLSMEVEAALVLMEGHEADEAKFAGLLLLVKHLQQRQQQQAEEQGQGQGQGQGEDPLAAGDARARLLAAVGPDFLARLLATPPPPPPPPPSSASASFSSSSDPSPSTTTPPFQPLALAVLRTLASDPVTLPSLRLPALLAPLVAALSAAEGSPEAEEDCLFLLHAFAAHDPGAAPLLARVGAARAVVGCLAASASASASSAAATAAAAKEPSGEGKEEKQKQEEAEEEAVPSLVRQACAALAALVAAEGRALTPPPQHPSLKKKKAPPPAVLLLDGPSLGALAELVAAERRPALRGALLPLLATVLAQRRGGNGNGGATAMLAAAGEGKEGGRLPTSFPASLRAILLPWLHGGVLEAHRDGALALLVHALGLLGQGWAGEGEEEEEGKGEGGGEGKKGRMGRGAVAGLFVSALAAEARMLADELEGLVAATHDAELRGDAHLQRRLGRARRMLPLCLDGLDSVLRFLCGAGDGECPLSAVLVDAPDATATTEWAALPSRVLLGVRSALHDAVAAVLKMLQGVASDLTDASDDEGTRLLLPVCREGARFLSAVLAEDPHCLSPAEALGALPVIRKLLALNDEDEKEEEEGAARCPPHLPIPWVARALEEEEEKAAGAAVEALVDQGVHVWLMDQLALPFSDPAAWPLRPRLSALWLLHSMLAAGGRLVPCIDHDCPLARHPQLRALLPRLGSTAVGSAQSPPQLRLHAAWFLLSLVVGEDDEGDEALLADDEAAAALLRGEGFVEGLADVVVVGRRAGWGEEAGDGEEEEEEDRGLWARVVALVAAGPKGLGLQSRVPAAVEGRYGRREAEAVRELLLEAMAGREAEAAVRGGGRG